MVRRYFFNAINEKHYNKKWRKEMGGRTYMDEGFVRGEVPMTQVVQDSINTLNAAIDRLDGIIKEMQDNCECKN
jgi:hypothetical protein